jgi:hypothetical protein
MMLAVMLRSADDAKLDSSMLARKYDIRGGDDAGGYFFDNKSFTDIQSAVAAAKLKASTA